MTVRETRSAPESNLGEFHALVVDDEPLPRAHLAYLLREAGVGQVREAESGTECTALCLAPDARPDWVFLDVRMPGMDGLSVADALAASSGRTPEVVFVTGYEDYAVAAFEKAATDYFLARPRFAQSVTAVFGLASCGAGCLARLRL